MATIAPAQRFPEPAAHAMPLEPDAAKKRMLIIVNPYATTVSDRLKNLVVYALQARYEATGEGGPIVIGNRAVSRG